MPVLRILLLPFAFLYKAITDLRNHLYEIGSRKSFQFDRFVISVGNLTVGGTGKTPLVELLIRELKQKYRLAVISRGYGRSTRGFRLASAEDSANTLGDEPFQFFKKFGGDIKVAVGEERALAIPELLFRDETIEVIILDDAYQHRSVVPHYNILINEYSRPFYNDYVLPAGMLREGRKNANRADAVIVTKCPAELKEEEKNAIKRKIQRYVSNEVPIYFTGIRYLDPLPVFGPPQFGNDIFLFAGIGNPGPLVEHVDKYFNLLEFRSFPDHHKYTEKEIAAMAEQFEKHTSAAKCIVTTEKDMVRLLGMTEIAQQLEEYPVFYLPIELYFLENGHFFAENLIERIGKELQVEQLN
jgi:tetraacyldisaccharide 4'-kinase